MLSRHETKTRAQALADCAIPAFGRSHQGTLGRLKLAAGRKRQGATAVAGGKDSAAVRPHRWHLIVTMAPSFPLFVDENACQVFCNRPRQFYLPQDKREAMAAAAEQRQKQFGQGGLTANQERQVALADRRQRDELVGKITAHYQARGKEPPFGLASCSVAQLKRHLETVKKPQR